MGYARFAIYYLPPEGTLADFGAHWLGWDITKGVECGQLDIPGLGDLTKVPRKYGFHGTLKPPFRLEPDKNPAALRQAVAGLAGRLSPGRANGLEPTTMGGFLALTPIGNGDALGGVAAACVRELDDFRDLPTDAELERRRRANLTNRQEAMLERWGYPYVMEEFRFHLTLSGRLPLGEEDSWSESVRAHMPALPEPFSIDEIALCGERPDRRFELIERFKLTG